MLGALAFVYLFVIVVDPWGMLPLSPPLPRVPVSTNARFSMPMLATAARFDSAVVGTSSSRLLRPEELDRLLGGRFVNLAMNAATAWEQARMLRLFARTHPAARTVVLGIDNQWCTPVPQRGSGREFPGWMYEGSRWAGYGAVFNLYAVQEAGSQLWIMLGLKRRRYGLDGYTRFVPPDDAYDPARVADAFARWGTPPISPARDTPRTFPALPELEAALHTLPPGTRKLLMFTPAHIGQQGSPGSDVAADWTACKAAVATLAARVPHTLVLDLLRPSDITADRANYWDPVHYRVAVADRIAAELADALAGRPTQDGVVLSR